MIEVCGKIKYLQLHGKYFIVKGNRLKFEIHGH